MHADIAEEMSIDLVRAVRGRRTQTGLSRSLGYRSNIVHRWETRQCAPVAARFLQLCLRLKPAMKELIPRFLKGAPSWYDPAEPFSPDAVAALLRHLRGRTPIRSLVERTGCSRFQIGRWLSGGAEPKLPEFLALVEACTRRVLDFIAGIVDPLSMTSTARLWRELQRAREAAYEWPMSQAVLHALELRAYREQRSASAALLFLCARLGLSLEEVEEGLRVLEQSGQVRKMRGRYRLHRVQSIDTSQDPERSRALKAQWTELAVQRLRAGTPGVHGYSVFAVTRADLARLRELELEYVRAMHSVIADSAPAECVGLYCVHLLDLGSDQNALARPAPQARG
jgi:hypothetical protein